MIDVNIYIEKNTHNFFNGKIIIQISYGMQNKENLNIDVVLDTIDTFRHGFHI